MSVIPTVPVTVRYQDAQGQGIAGATVTAKLTTAERYQGLEVPAQVVGETDDQGKVVLQLCPNALGTEGSAYSLAASDPSSGTVVRFVAIPNAACDVVIGRHVVTAVTGPQGVPGPKGERGDKGDPGEAGDPAPRDHTLLSNIGANTHAQLDAHLVDAANPHGTTAAQVGAIPASEMRDTLGAFAGVIRPTLNLFCPSMTDDSVPLGTFSRSAAKWRLGPTGLLESVAADKVAREWDKDGNLLGWLLEEQRTNQFQHSSDFTNAVWTHLNSAIYPNAVMSPTGTTDASKLTPAKLNAEHSIYYMRTGASETVVLSCFARKGEYNYLYLSFANFLSEAKFAIFDLTNGSVTMVDPDGLDYTDVKAGSKHYGNGWYRCWISVKKKSASNINVSCIGVTSSHLYASTQCDGTSGVYIWGAQLEAGSFPTSYIPTTTAPVTRPADVWTIPTSTFPFNAIEGTFYVAADRNTPVANYSRFFEAYDGTGANGLSLVVNPDGLLYASIYAGSTQYYDWNPFGVYAGEKTKLSMGYKINDLGYAKDGVTKVTDTTAAVMPSNLSNVKIGTDATNGCNLNGHIRHIAYFPRRLSNADMQLITA